MALPLSGLPDEVELVKIEHPDCSLVIKGKPYHYLYEGLKQYREMDVHDVMQFAVRGSDEYEVFDVEKMELSTSSQLRPIFFENGSYQLIVVPKQDRPLSFYHESSVLRRAVSEVKVGNQHILMGNLQFQNEVGLTTFEIRSGEDTLLDVTLEIFPTKLDYKKDYQQLLEEVNEEIYNLAFHFIKKTYLGARIKVDGRPSQSEFFRLFTKHFQQFVQAIRRIENQPHHKLETTYQKVRGDQLGKMDARSRNYLRKRSHLFVETNRGMELAGRSLMPREGITAKKELTYDTFENRYVKWMVSRLIEKVEDLIDSICNRHYRDQEKLDTALIEQLQNMKDVLEKRLKNAFWRRIGRLDRSAMSLVLQMAPGYRDAYQTFLTVSKGLMLQGKMYRMSVKDVATLYEYWTFLKLGQILSRKYEQVSQDIVKVNRNGLFVNLESNKTARRVFKQPITQEKIELVYQKYEGRLPTVTQKPDTMLSIQKKGKQYAYNYVFDAKYRVDYAQEGGYYRRNYQTPGPMEDDINTMHRYRDSIVAANDGPYERTAFGAYVLFPWHDETEYKQHHFYQSVDTVNIGAFPFLPNTTDLVEQFVERLIEKSSEELQREGILPRGAQAEWQSSLVDHVLVGLVASRDDYVRSLQTLQYTLPVASLRNGWQEAKYVALYVKKGIHAWNGIKEYGKIVSVDIHDDKVVFTLDVWKNLKQVIAPVHYGISTYMMTTLTQLKEAKELPELYMKSKEETQLWKMLRRVSDRVHIQLDDTTIDSASGIEEFVFKNSRIKVDRDKRMIEIQTEEAGKMFPLDILLTNPSKVFKEILAVL
ncbi:restriction endonuclease-like protein [Bacillus testis]|uniref:restriction endonuclease-like protein n=1 Tax=Bacillus testis TaxID=1622072 RepID=UPI00067EEE55|nr:restriction endonuclease-like protein [Bacillus testis]